MKQLKILHIINDLSSGGAENALINYLNYDNNNINYLFRFSKISKNNIELDEDNTIDLNSNTKNGYSILTFLKLFKQTKAINPDIIHVHLFPSFYLAAILSFFYKSKFVVTEHSLSNSRRKVGFRTVEKIIYSRFDSIISVSEDVQASLTKWLRIKRKNKYLVIPNGIDIHRFQESKKYSLRDELKLTSSDVIIMLVARLSEEKNLIVAVESMQYLTSDYKLVLVGEGPLEDTLRNKIKDLNLKNQVSILGFRAYVSELLPNADVFLLPSLQEGFGISVLEAIARKRRIVLSDIPLFLNQYKEINPIYFEVHSPIDLARKIELSMLTIPNDKLYDEFLLKYDINKIVNKLNGFYRDLFSRP
jgi:glycosyltransferase involved in cell wall biosynthesis